MAKALALGVSRSSSPGSSWCRLGRLSLSAALIVLAGHAAADEPWQSDWSGGPATAGPVATWDDTFASASGISWLAIAGQLALSSTPVEAPIGHPLDTAIDGPASLAPADMDGDGDLDVVGAAITGHLVVLWVNEGGSPVTWTRRVVDPFFEGAASVDVADVDADGDRDILGTSWDSGEVAWWENSDGGGVNWSEHAITSGFAGGHWIDAADLDNDGDLDAVGAAANANTVACWYNLGGSPLRWVESVINGSFQGARAVVPGDVDGDGLVDLVGAALIDDAVVLWRNLGGSPATFSEQVLSDSFSDAHGVQVVDLDRDGDLDVIGAGYRSPWPVWWRNDGGSPITWVEAGFADVFPGALIVDAADLDGDNDLDLFATSESWDQVSLWWNDGGPPEQWPRSTLASGFDGAWPVAAADLDGDGALDLVAGASYGAEVAWWQLGGFQPEGVLTSTVLDLGAAATTLRVALDVSAPPSTSIDVALRLSNDPELMGAWHPVAPDRDLQVVGNGAKFLQYRLSLRTASPEVSPVVREIDFIVNGGVELAPRDPHGRLEP